MPFDIGPSAISIILVAFAIVWIAVPRQRRPEQVAADVATRAPSSTRRLARGEITRDEYDTAMRALGIAGSPR